MFHNAVVFAKNGSETVRVKKGQQEHVVLRDVQALELRCGEESRQVDLDIEYHSFLLRGHYFHFQLIPVRARRTFTSFKTQAVNTEQNIVLGHRGSGSDEKNRKIFGELKFRENTVPSLLNGLRKLDGVEFDVQLSGDE